MSAREYRRERITSLVRYSETSPEMVMQRLLGMPSSASSNSSSGGGFGGGFSGGGGGGFGGGGGGGGF